MIKRSFVFFILAVLCALTVVGTGFALWIFNGTSASSNLGVTVTESSTLGTFSVPNVGHVVLDGGTGAGINPTITGVSFYKSDENGNIIPDTDLTVSFTVKSEYYDEINENGNWDKVHFGIKIDVPDSLTGIIGHTDFYNKHLGANGYIDLKTLVIELTDHFDDPDFSKSDFNYTAGVFTFKLTTVTLNRFFTYITDKEPTTLPNYEILGGNFAPEFEIELWQGYTEI